MFAPEILYPKAVCPCSRHLERDFFSEINMKWQTHRGSTAIVIMTYAGLVLCTNFETAESFRLFEASRIDKNLYKLYCSFLVTFRWWEIAFFICQPFYLTAKSWHATPVVPSFFGSVLQTARVYPRHNLSIAAWRSNKYSHFLFTIFIIIIRWLLLLF